MTDSTSSRANPTDLLFERLRDQPAWPGIAEAARKGIGSLHVHKLAGSSRALAAAELARETGRSLLYIAPDEERTDAALADLKLFLDRPILHLAQHTADPYEAKTPHSETAAARLETLSRLARDGQGVVVTSVRGISEQVVGPEVLKQHLVMFRIGESVDLDDLLVRLTYLGYNRQSAVEEVGDYALRGGILDIYSLGGTHPIRIEIEYDEVSSLREFDVHTQRSVRTLDHALILPRHEILLTQERIDAAVAAFRTRDETAAAELADAFDTDVHPVGIERIAASLGQELGSFLRYLPQDTLVVVEEPSLVRGKAELLWDQVLEAHAATRTDFPNVDTPEKLYLTPDALRDGLSAYFQLRISDFEPEGDGPRAVVRSRPPLTFGRKIDLWRDYLGGGLLANGFRVVLFCDNQGQLDRLRELLLEDGHLDIQLELGVLSAGFVLEDAKLAVLTDHEFFGRARRRARAKRFRSGFGLKELSTLKMGSYVVHVEHGIGHYIGLTRLEVNGHLTDVLHLEYAGGDKLYVPVDQLGLIQRYSTEEGKKAHVSRLGGTGWAKTTSKAKRVIREMAGELLRAYAIRKGHPGHAFPPDTVWQRELEGSFPYDETPDQLTAMEAVRKDMEAPSPMDRLICGDVGYGKTEVAVRAAFKTIMDGKQVAVLVPTTILAEQHYFTFRDRFADFPVTVDMISRFRSAQESKEVKRKVASGELDVAVGTHALIAKDVKFKNLGLIIIVEEQRFGVAHKERLRGLRTSVDVLTLTATPIPRSLNLSLLGARDITVIQTPPVGRMPVQTEISDFDREVVREALLREADRGGQSFFVHNRVESIQTMGVYLRTLCPQLTVAIAHGQMGPRQLEKVMTDFIQKKYDVLLATMIIENGLDIPSVNTMIVNRADAFGLSQLYQLRGRVGRSTQKAYCYFMVPASKALTETAMKRLRAIAEFDSLGSGFALAMRDLEIRGAGNILGREQSGHVVSVGFEMYCRLLDEAVRELKGLPAEERPEPYLSTDVDAYLPDDYVTEAEEKVAFYKRLADARELIDVERLESELRDRFGRLSPDAEGLFALRRVRVLGSLAGLSSVTIRKDRVELELAAPPEPGDLRRWMQAISLPVEFQATGRFVLKAKGGVREALIILSGMAGVAPPVEEPVN